MRLVAIGFFDEFVKTHLVVVCRELIAGLALVQVNLVDPGERLLQAVLLIKSASRWKIVHNRLSLAPFRDDQ